ncbi:MAG: DUF3568 family protein [Candidatus Omnitrophota bacterium]|jgi:hypothetical protein
MKKLIVFLSAGLILVNIYGCVALIAGGAAGGAGTAVWLSGKIVQQVNASLEQTTKASKSALHSLRLSIVTKETTNRGVVQIRSYDADGKKIWIDIYRITDISSQIQVRVGTVFSNKESAERILRMILQNL